jgi:hypothetical protein
VRRKETTVFAILTIAALYGVYRAVHAALESLRALPQRNEDMIFY